MRKLGKRGKAWKSALLILKKQFAAQGITTCEFNFEGCWKNTALGFSHQEKRRFIPEDKLTEGVVLCCAPCHAFIEDHKDKKQLHEVAIARRNQYSQLYSIDFI